MSRILSSITDKLIAPANAVYNNLSKGTWAVWIKLTSFPTTPNNYFTFFAKDPLNTENVGIFLTNLGSVGEVTFQAVINAPDGSVISNTVSNASGTLISLGVWTHLVVTFDAAATPQSAKIYVNGVVAPDETFGDSSGNINTDAAGGYYLGNDTFSISPNFALAEAVIFPNAVLSDVQIASLAASTNGVPGGFPTEAAYWHLCGLASPEPDSSGNGLSAVLTGTTAGGNSPGYSSCGGSSTPSIMTITSTIQKAVLLDTGVQANNYAVYQVDAGPELKIGESVVVAGCTTSTFNGTFTVASVGTFVVPNNPSDTNGGFSTWTGFSVTMNHAAIAIEIEPTAATDGAEGSPLGTATLTVTQ